MKWAEIPTANDQASLLVWALMFAIEDPIRSMEENIIEMFSSEGEIGGDPGWGVHHYNDGQGNDQFNVWVDPRVSGLKERERTYSGNSVRKTTRELLNAFSDAYPNKRKEVDRLFSRCNL
jgi:hypothetical protein